jgi:hypothetical protein
VYCACRLYFDFRSHDDSVSRDGVVHAISQRGAPVRTAALDRAETARRHRHAMRANKRGCENVGSGSSQIFATYSSLGCFAERAAGQPIGLHGRRVPPKMWARMSDFRQIAIIRSRAPNGSNHSSRGSSLGVAVRRAGGAKRHARLNCYPVPCRPRPALAWLGCA